MNKMNKKQQQRDTTSLKNIVFFLKMYFSHMFLFYARKKFTCTYSPKPFKTS